MYEKTYRFKCAVCRVEKIGVKIQKYCSKECYLEWSGKKSAWKGLASGTVGAIQEYRVGVELLIKGYEVFRPLSPSCSCDLLAMKDGKIIKLEVRTAYQNKVGKIVCSKKNIRAEYLALALPKHIVYEPTLE